MLVKHIQTIGVGLIMSIMIMAPGLPSFAADLTVTTLEDELNSDGDCSLREAIEAANTDTAVDACGSGSGDDTITFDLPAGSTITLGGSELSITASLTITGPGTDQLAISGNNASRIFFIDGTTSTVVSISNVTIRDGNAGSDRGGGLYNRYSQVTLDNVIVSNNTTTGNGGGLYSYYGALTLRNSLVSGNTASSGGGAYHSSYSDSAVTMEVIASTIADNTATDNGGGLYTSGGVMTLARSTVSANQATYGGGLRNSSGTMILENSTVSGNSARGAGIWNQYGVLTLTHCTVSNNAGNSGYNGAAIITTRQGESGILNLINTLVAGNHNAGAPRDCKTFGDLMGTDSGNLIESHSNCGTPVSTADPLLGPLQDNGGPTQTHALQIGSPAIDAGDTASCLTTDQRGISRSQGSGCDIGAYEYQSSPTPTPTPTTTPTPTPTPTATPTPTPTPTVTPGNLIVTTTDDELNSDDDCSLREAIEAANTDMAVDACGSGSSDDTITFNLPANSTITLTAGELSVTTSLSLTGPGATDLAVSGNNTSRVFSISGASTAVTISNVTIRDGNAGSDRGGGLYNQHSQVTLDNVIISNNTTTGNGGGLYSYYGPLTLRNSLVSGNTASSGGGAYHSSYSDSAVTMEVIASTIADNTATGNGGGLYTSGGVMTLARSTVSANQAGSYGGGLRNSSGTMILENSTVSGNSSPSGAGIWNQYGVLTLTQCTVSNNTGNSGYNGAAIITTRKGESGILNVINTLIAGNLNANEPQDCKTFGESMGTDIGNLIESHSNCGTPVSSSDPLLGPLQDNGGPTATHALLAGSPTIDVGAPASCLATDQRGMSRPVDGDGDGTAACDIGAVEYQSEPLTYVLTVTKQGTGDGLVVGDGIECGYDCTETYADGTILDLQAYPDADSEFSGWLVDGEPPAQGGELVVNGDITLTAIFDTVAGACTPSNGGIEQCGDEIDNDCDGKIDEGCGCDTDFQNLQCCRGDSCIPMTSCSAGEAAIFLGCSNIACNPMVRCEAPEGGPCEDEIADDGIDNDCDGYIDEPI